MLKIDVHPKSDIRTTIPISISIQSSSAPSVYVEELGRIPTKTLEQGYRSEFWFQKAGRFEIIVKNKTEKVSQFIEVNEQQFLSFSREFGFFLVLFFIFMGGGVAWLKKTRER